MTPETTTTTTAIAPSDVGVAPITTPDHGESLAALEHVLATGDVANLSGPQRVAFYLHLCRSLGLNPASRPFDWIEFYDPETRARKLTLYLNQSGASQLRRVHRVSARITRREMVGDLFVVEAEGRTPDGRTGTASKYVAIVGNDGNRLRGQKLGNAYMKAETGALRRLTLAMVGLTSGPDDDADDVRRVVVDGNGEIIRNPSQAQAALARDPGMARVLGEPVYEDVAEASILDGTPSQAPTPAELEPKRRRVPRQSFKPSEDDVKRWLGAWFATVKGTSYDTDQARHDFVAAYTFDYPAALKTDSLREFFSHATERQAGDLLAQIRQYADDERRELAERDEQLGDVSHDDLASDGDESLEPF